MDILRVSLGVGGGLPGPFEEHQCAGVCEDTATSNRSSLFLKKGGSELLFSWFLAKVDTHLSSRYGAALYEHWLAENTASHSSSYCRTEPGTSLRAVGTCPAMVRMCHRPQQHRANGPCNVTSLSPSAALQGQG